jgi:hypothetical protein
MAGERSAKSGGQVSRTRAPKYSVAAVSRPSRPCGIIECHLQAVRKICLASGMLGGAIHANFQLVDFRAHAQHAHAASNRLELRWQQDLDGLILRSHGAAGWATAFPADLQRLSSPATILSSLRPAGLL